MADVLDQQNAPETSEDYSLGFSTTNAKEGVSFVPSVSARVSKVSAKLKKQGTPTGNVYITICANNSGKPGTVLATSSTKTNASLTTTATWYDFTFDTPYRAIKDTTYFVVFNSTHTIDGSNHPVNQATDTANYSGSSYNYNSDTSVWGNVLTKDFLFKQYYDDTPEASSSMFLLF